MTNSRAWRGYLLALILISLAIIFLGCVVTWGIANLRSEKMLLTGFICLLGLTLPVGLILGGAGIFIWLRARAEETELGRLDRQRTLLNMVETAGEVSLRQAALELGVPLKVIEADLRDLVGKGLFSGYVHWEAGMLYARSAADLQSRQKCPNCGADLKLVGKDVVECPYCGTTIFLSE